MEAVSKELVEWANSLKPWQRDALRRLANKETLTSAEQAEVVAILKAENGIELPTTPPDPEPLTADHLSASTAANVVRLKGISNAAHVNRLSDKVVLPFDGQGLSIVYGDNGSGKSGYVRILRGACRSRISSVDGESPPILPDIYATAPAGPASADLMIEVAGAPSTVSWTDGETTPAELTEIAVFDSEAAALYIDESNHISFLPYNLDLCFRLNNLCIAIREELDDEIRSLEGTVAVPLIALDVSTPTSTFLTGLSAETTELEVDAATSFTEAHVTRLEELGRLLDQTAIGSADLTVLGDWLTSLAEKIDAAVARTDDEAVKELRRLSAEAGSARRAADDAAKGAFSGDPLAAVGGDSWRRMFEAARAYSLEAYPSLPFPVTDDEARCVLCQQTLDSDAAARLKRFEAFVTGALRQQADRAETAWQESLQAFTDGELARDEDHDTRMGQIRSRDSQTATLLEAFLQGLSHRHRAILQSLNGQEAAIEALPSSPVERLRTLKGLIADEAQRHFEALDPKAREKLTAEQLDLKSRELAAALRPAVLDRIKDLRLLRNLKACFDSAVTTGITRKAGELSEKHLTPTVKSLLEEETKALRLARLQPQLSRKPDRRGAQYKIEIQPGSKLKTSQVLSEGEHRALALAAFLAEVRSMSATSTIIVDDPVSSLDHARSSLVAQRLVDEARQRQVIVFTHSLVFLHHLNAAADEAQVQSEVLGIFSNDQASGLLDPGGTPWQGKSLGGRIALLRQLLPAIRTAANGPPADYGLQVRNWYGRLRDCWERLVEERLFRGVITRFDQSVKTQNLRYVELDDATFGRIEAGMTRASTYSHDNPAAGTAPVPTPDEIDADVKELEDVAAAIGAAQKIAEQRRT